MSTYRITIKYWDRHYGDGHTQFSRKFEARKSKKADQAAIDALEEGLRQHPKPQGRDAHAWAERSDNGYPSTLRAYDGSSGTWVRIEPRRPAAASETREAMRKINQKGYKFYILVNGKIESGWDYKEDALDHKRDNLPDPKAGRILSKAGVKRLGLDPDNNDSWLMGPVPGVGEQRSRIVADFNTLGDLVAHAGRELGATHAVVDGPATLIFFPRGGAHPYEEARVWRKGGYWHAEGPGARTGVSRLPAGAKPIGAGSRRAAEMRENGDEASAAVAYADDQIHGGYFLDWCREQLIEAQRSGLDNLPLDTKEHAAVVARNMLKQLEWDTKREINRSKEFFRAFSARLAERAVVDWLADELLSMNAEIAGAAVAERRTRVRDYEAVDTRDRRIAGPFKQYSDAKDAAGSGGHVKFVPGKRAVRASSGDTLRRDDMRPHDPFWQLPEPLQRKLRRAARSKRSVPLTKAEREQIDRDWIMVDGTQVRIGAESAWRM